VTVNGLRFDGESPLGAVTLQFWTELDAEAPSHGATFSVKAPATPEQVAAKRAETAANFSPKHNNT
jgi:hypothetical protein